MNIHIKRLKNDGDLREIFQMLKTIEDNENSFTNPVYNMDYEQYLDWIDEMYNWGNGIDLPNGYVRQWIYWLYEDNVPIGIGKIRYELTKASRENGGTIGYAIGRDFRGKKYSNVFLKLLLEEARELQVKDILLTVNKGNYASRKAVENNNGVLISENDVRWFFEIKD